MSFVVVDRWRADPLAIGLARPSEHDQLVYVSIDPDTHGRYFMARELPSGNDLEPNRVGGLDQFQDVDALARAIAEHLGAT